MSDQWIAKEMGKRGSRPDEEEQKLLKEEVIVLVRGRNFYGDDIFSYVKLPYGEVDSLKSVVESGEDFDVHEFGEVVAAGKGSPDEELEAEIAQEFGMVSLPRPQPKPVNTTIPVAWDAEEDEEGY